MTGRDLCHDVLTELGVCGPIQTPQAKDLDVVLRMGQRLIDNWNADRMAIYADQFLTFTITPSLQPHTIGPTTATWTTTQRPVSIEAAQLILNTSQSLPITIVPALWWQGLIDTGLSSSIPTELYYEPSWPNGSIYLYALPTVAYDVQLLCRQVLTAFTLATTITMPPGYRDAMTLTLKEMCAAAFGKSLTPDEKLDASKSRARIFSNNVHAPALTCDAPGVGHGAFDYLTRRPV